VGTRGKASARGAKRKKKGGLEAAELRGRKNYHSIGFGMKAQKRGSFTRGGAKPLRVGKKE